MLRHTFARNFSHLVREVDAKGFAGDFRRLSHVRDPGTLARAAALAKRKENTVICGHAGTGKLTLLKAIGQHCEDVLGLKVAYVSADSQRANRLDGYLLHHFLGLRVSRDELPCQEQLEGTLERHVRLVESTYASSFPSLQNTDVLVLDALESVPPVVLQSMDAVGRRQRGKPNAPFGGLRVFAAADFWRLAVHPTSDTGGYLYQLDAWNAMFPRQEVLETTHGQDAVLNEYTLKALHGNLTAADMQALESLSFANKPAEQQRQQQRRHIFRGTGDDEEWAEDGEEDDEDERANDTATNGDRASPLDEPSAPTAESTSAALLNDDVTANAEALVRFTVRFPKQPSLRVPPPRHRQLRHAEMGHFLLNALMQTLQPTSVGLVDSLSVEVGSRVHLLLDGQASYGVPRGSVGEVLGVREHALTVYFPRVHRTVDIPRMRVTIYHPDYPEIQHEIRQFPLFPRQRLCPSAILSHPSCYYVSLDGRRMADTNNLGNLLTQMRSFDDFTLCNVADFAHLDGAVHEPTRIYYSHLLHRPLGSTAEQWCRNCKAFVPREEFFDHWTACVKAQRWCGECSRTVPLELLEPHKEKHQVVLCMDCGQAVEWRHWEAHRLSCSAMMREISPDNQFLPLRTRQLALELGLDKRDLHTMKSFSRSMLPKSSRAA